MTTETVKEPIKLLDVSTMMLTDEDSNRLKAIAEGWGKGANTQQKAFGSLVQFCTIKMHPYTEVRASGPKVVAGAQKRLKLLLETSILASLNLTGTYVTPALRLAEMTIEGASNAIGFVLKHLTDSGQGDRGDLPGPVFAPARLIVSMKELRIDDEEKSKFRVDPEDGLQLKDKLGVWHRFGALSIEDIKRLLRTGVTDPKALDELNRFLGEDVLEGERVRPGSLGHLIIHLKELARGEDMFILDVCEQLEEIQVSLRDATLSRNREERAIAEAMADQKRLEARLKKSASLGADRAVGEEILATKASESHDIEATKSDES